MQKKVSVPLRYGKKIETKLQDVCIEYLKSLPNCYVENSWGRTGNKGKADLTGCLAGKYFAIELKTTMGVVSVEQKSYLAKISNAGGIVGVAHSLHEMKRILKTP